MICDRCGTMSSVQFSASGYSLCPKCAKLLYVLLESKHRLPASWRARQDAPGTGREIRAAGGGVMVRIRWWDGATWAVSGLLPLDEARALVGHYADATIVRDEPGWPPL